MNEPNVEQETEDSTDIAEDAVEIQQAIANLFAAMDANPTKKNHVLEVHLHHLIAAGMLEGRFKDFLAELRVQGISTQGLLKQFRAACDRYDKRIDAAELVANGEEWKSKLKTNRSGYPFEESGNFALILRHDKRFAGKLTYDALKGICNQWC